MELRLEGILSYKDKFNRLKFVFIDDIDQSDKTRQKLITYCQNEYKPFDTEEFTVTLPKHSHNIPDDITNLIGLRCVVYVKLTIYSFVSKLEKNAGEKIKGTQLVLKDIMKAT